MNVLPFISIVIPIYNAELYLKNCIKSVLNQSFKNFELILINDGSFDNSQEICKCFTLADSRVKVFNQSNSGVSAARNLGIKKSIGEWICFIDSDDWIDVDFLENFNSNRGGFDFIIQGYKVVDNQGVILKEYGYFNRKFDNFIDFLIYSETNNILNSPCFRLFKREIINNKNLKFDIKFSLGEDHLFVLEYLKYVKDYNVVYSKGYNYRKGHNENSLTTKELCIDSFIDYIELSYRLKVELGNIFNIKEQQLKHFNVIYNNWTLSVIKQSISKKKGSIDFAKLEVLLNMFKRSDGVFKGKNVFKNINNVIIVKIIKSNLFDNKLKMNLLIYMNQLKNIFKR